MLKICKLFSAALCFCAFSNKAIGQDILWKNNFGGSGDDSYTSATAVSDGIVAVGHAALTSFGNGNWESILGKGSTDAVIVKYNSTNNVIWQKHFGGNWDDTYSHITTTSDNNIIVVGHSDEGSFGSGDWASFTGKGSIDATIVKYNNINGEILWRNHFGGNGDDFFNAATSIQNAVFAVGYSNGFGNGDWKDYSGKGNQDAIIVKYDNNGNVIWKKHFGGSGNDIFHSVVAVSDGIIAVGTSNKASFDQGDWMGITGKGGIDAIIVKYNFDGEIVWKNNFGGSNNDVFNAVTVLSDGIVAVGSSASNDGDWAGISGKGGIDAIIVKYDFLGRVVWKKNFGGNGSDSYANVSMLVDGIIAVGYSTAFGNGDWTNITGKGSEDAIIVKYDFDGEIIWKNNFGGSGNDIYHSVVIGSDGIFTLGHSTAFGNGDWTNVIGKGSQDAIVVKYHIPVINISKVPVTAIAGIPLTLTGTVNPSIATYQTIVWSIADTGTTGAILTENGLQGTSAGTVTVTATIAHGLGINRDYTQDFTINVIASPIITTSSFPNGKVNTAYSQDLTAIDGGSPVTWSLENGKLPDGLSLYGNGTISGTPTTKGTFTFTVKATNIAGFDIKTLKIEIEKATNGGGNDNVGIEEVETTDSKLSVYPNPTKGMLNLTGCNVQENTVIEIFDVTGRLLKSTTANLQSETMLDVSQLTSGIYYLKTNNKVVKFIKD